MSELFSNGYAVVVGVGADQPVTVTDATGIANQLRDPTRCAYPEDQVCLLTSKDAYAKDIRSALDWLYKETGDEDTAIVYFSGHGETQPYFHLVPFGYDS